jgi:hypothetical protein
LTGALTSSDWTTFNGKLGSSAIGTSVQAYSANLGSFATVAPSANILTFLGASDYAGAMNMLASVALTRSLNMGTYNVTNGSTAGFSHYSSTAANGTHMLGMGNSVSYTGARTAGTVFHNMTTFYFCPTDNVCKRVMLQ